MASGGHVCAEQIDKKTYRKEGRKQAERKKHLHEEFEDEYSYLLEALREEADFWEEVEKEETLVIPGKVVKTATTSVGPDLQGDGSVDGKINKSKRGRANTKVY